MNKNFFAGLFVGLGLLAIFAFRPTAEKPAAGVQKWEYMTLLSIWGPKHEEKLKEVGLEGWELIGNEGGGYVFKRPFE